MVRLSCPSCNTSFALADLPADRRAACPRCGDVFPIRGFTEEAGPTAANNPQCEFRNPHSSRRAAARWSVQRTVVVALAMGLVGLLAGLGVYFARNGFRTNPPPKPEPPLVAATAPAQLVGLGYLPADVSIAFALQPGPALAYAERTKQDPRELFTKAGLPRQLFDAVANLGLELVQIDHIAGGTSFSELRFTFVLVLRHPLDDEEKFLRRLKATKPHSTKERYRVALAGVPLAVTLARASPTVWVFGLDETKDLSAAEKGGHGPGGNQFAPGLREMIARVPPDAAAWLATDDERWDDKPLVRLALGQFGKKEGAAVLAKGRAVVAALSLADPPRLRLFVKTADAATGERVRTYFQGKAATGDQAASGGAGELALFDTPIDPATVFATLREMLNDAANPSH